MSLLFIVATMTAVVSASERQVVDNLPHLKREPQVLRVATGKPWVVRLSLPSGWKINHQAPSWIALFRKNGKNERDGQGYHLIQEFSRAQLEKGKAELPQLAPSIEYRLQGTFYFCEATKPTVCLLQSIDEVLSPQAGAASEIQIHLDQ